MRAKCKISKCVSGGGEWKSKLNKKKENKRKCEDESKKMMRRRRRKKKKTLTDGGGGDEERLLLHVSLFGRHTTGTKKRHTSTDSWLS